MLERHAFATPNSVKVPILLEEPGVAPGATGGQARDRLADRIMRLDRIWR